MTIERGYQIFVRTAYIAGIAIIIVFLPFSKYILSIGMWTVTGAWILERVSITRYLSLFASGALLKKIFLAFPFALYLMFISIGKGFRIFYRNKPAVVLASVMLLHLLGLLITTDFNYAFKDIRTKAPMLILPLYFSTLKAFSRTHFYRFLFLFLINLLIVTLANSWKIMHFEFIDIRDISAHVSHIILALMVSMAIFFLGYFLFKRSRIPVWIKVVSAFLMIWFFIYLLISRSFTGLSVLAITLFVLLIIYAIRNRNLWLKTIILAAILVLTVGLGWYLQTIVREYYRVEPIDLTRLDSLSPGGNPYTHILENKQTENGHYIWTYIQWWELGEGWKRRSSIPIDSLDLRGQEIKFTLIRYMASRGLRKDAGGIDQLTDQDVQAIEKGIANVVNLNRFSLRGRLYELLMGFENYRTTGDPTGSSVMQRLEFWKASIGIIGENWLTGVGTGDMNLAFHDQYRKMQTKLDPEQWWRSHNQYFSILIGFGIFGLVWFLFSLIYPAWVKYGFSDYFFLVFFIIAMLSLLTEDTLESQAGVSFFYFFYSFLLFARREQDPL